MSRSTPEVREPKTRRPGRFTLRVEPGRALLYDRRTHQYTSRSPAEAFLLVASRELGVRSAASTLRSRVGAEADVALRVLTFEGALSSRRPFAGRILELPSVAGAFSAPLVAHLGVTAACNFACAHCYSSSGRRARDELTASELLGLVDELSRLGCQKLVLGGGEPFLDPELPALIRHADRLGVDCFVHTNASLLTRELLAELARCPPAGLAVSLDGPDAGSNDSVRGRGAFGKALRGIAQLRASYAPGFNLSVTVTPSNAASMGRMVGLAKREGAGVLLLRPAYPAGKALGSSVVCDRASFAGAVERARVRAARLGVSVDAPHPDERGAPAFEGFGCVAARVVLGITPSGGVTPCLNLPEPFVAGSVRERSIAELWRRGRSFVVLRGQRPGERCGACAEYESCRGGCRARALVAGNGIGGPDSWCAQAT